MEIIDLPWLPDPPTEFAARCKALSPADAAVGKAVQFLAGHRLSAREAGRLGRAIERLQSAGAALDPLVPFKLGILSNGTYDLIAQELRAAAARYGVALHVELAAFDSVPQQALDPLSSINQAELDAVLLALDHRWLDLSRPRFDDASADAVDAAIERLSFVVDSLKINSTASLILQTVPVPPISAFGSHDRQIDGSTRSMLQLANHRIARLAQETRSYLVDVEALAAEVGTAIWFDPVQWHLYKLPFDARCNPLFCDRLGRVMGAIRGRSRKCLVLDLDNTIWGGVVGDDGLEALEIGSGTSAGEAFAAVQQAALDLRSRGIVLAVCSKNDEPIARRPFSDHPDMLLREEHIAIFQANWLDKASNLEAIASALALGLDSLVLLDDNPAERAQVRAALPMVAVPELPADPAWYPTYLSAGGYFEAVSFTPEDRLRARSYHDAARRAEVISKARDLGDYLRALQMTIRIAPIDAVSRTRASQLINKSNQFNLTTRRYTEAQLAALADDPATFTFQARLTDRFGDLGLISVVICRRLAGEPAWEIDTWLMSCRVLGRRVEEAMLAAIVAKARECGVARLIGQYIPTPKNAMVADHYRKLGFCEVPANSPALRTCHLDLATFVEPALPFNLGSSA